MANACKGRFDREIDAAMAAIEGGTWERDPRGIFGAHDFGIEEAAGRRPGCSAVGYYGVTVLVTECAWELSCMLWTIRDLAYGRLVGLERYWFYDQMADAAKASLEAEGDGLNIVRAVADAARAIGHDAGTWYFAYGSNMDAAQMAARCPDAVLRGTSALGGWRIGIDAAGYATIFEEEGARTEGAMWQVSMADEVELDRYEGVSSGCYAKRRLHPEWGERLPNGALVYVSERTPLLEVSPRAGYMARVVAAAGELGLGADAVAELRRLSGLS